MRSSLHIADQKWLVMCAVMLLLSAAAAGQGASPTPTPSESIFQRAVEKVKAAETMPPDSEKYHQQLKEALADLNRALELDPGNRKYLIERGKTYEADGQLDLALKDFDAAISINSDDPGPYVLRAEVYSSLGKLESALADLRDRLEA